MMKSKVITLLLIVTSLLWAFAVGAQDDAARVWLTTSTEQATSGDEVTVTVHVSGAADIYGSSFKLAYDPQAFEVVLTDGTVVQPGSFFGDAPSFPLLNQADAGVIEYAMTLVQPAEPVSGAGVLGTITLRALEAAAVAVTPVEASLVSPQFTEVDGRKVAQQMDKITPQLAETISDTALAALPAEANAAAVVPVTEPNPAVLAADNSVATASVAGALAAQPEAGSLTFQPVPVSLGAPISHPAIILSALLFGLAIALLVVSVGLYTRLRSINLLMGD